MGIPDCYRYLPSGATPAHKRWVYKPGEACTQVDAVEELNRLHKEVERLREYVGFCKPHQESPENKGTGITCCALCVTERAETAERKLERLDEVINTAVTILDTLERGREISGMKIDRERYTREAKLALLDQWEQAHWMPLPEPPKESG